MELIDGLECSPRALYTGAIGWIDAPKRASDRCGDFCMSVAIRTILLGEPDEGWHPAQLGVGGGIVLDSTPANEFAETQLKASFVTGLDPGFRLLETMRASRAVGIRHLEAHLHRLSTSARHFGFALDLALVRILLGEAVEGLRDGASYRLRLALHHDGTPQLDVVSLAGRSAPRPLYLVAEDILTGDERALVGHKTTLRATYDRAIRRAEACQALDILFFNRHGELTEGARTNVLVRIDGRWWTPPVQCGLLPGTMRGRLLRKHGLVRERVLHRADLDRAEAVALCNSLRGVIRVGRAVTAPSAGGATGCRPTLALHGS